MRVIKQSAKPERWQQLDALSRKNGPHAPIYLINGDRYLGSWVNNMKHGNGTYFYNKSGSMYEGEWKFDKRDGYGSYSVENRNDKDKQSSSIVEEAIRMRLEAKSKKIRKDDFPLASTMRRLYVGEWKEDLKSGHGTYFYLDGSVYDGNWAHNMRQGWGKMTFANGSTYEGEWHQEKRHGQGILLLLNGDRYEGMWMNDRKEGPGKFIYKSKRQFYEGEWSNGMPKFGSLSDFPSVPGIPSRKFPIPEIKLMDVANVLRGQHELLLEERTKTELEAQ